MPPGSAADALLTIDLGAIAHNWRLLKARLERAEAAAVVKADAYGLGMAEVAPALWDAGCRRFFVASTEEGVALRAMVPQAWIAVLLGTQGDDAGLLRRHNLCPVLNHLGQIEAWRAEAAAHGPLGAVLHVDTGLSRLGLPADEVARLSEAPELLAGIVPELVMSHLACAELPDAPKNAEQRAAFLAARARLRPLTGALPASLANSSGIFLGPDYQFDIVRPGVALYGVNPTPGAPNPMSEVVRLQGRIVQVRRVDSLQTVGYGAAHVVRRPSRIATVSVGYADGYLRSASNRASGYIEGIRVPIVGRVSMDMITLDVTDIPPQHAHPGAPVDLIGGPHPIDALAAEAGTVGYEILTSLGRRYRRRYIGRASEREEQA